MAGPLQAGDLVAFGKLAWDVYQLGFTEEHNATKLYTEFGRDVQGLAQNLDILTNVVGQATHTLYRECGQNAGAIVRWDPYSLTQIIGDYETTLRECEQLIKTNQKYAVGTTVKRNIEWNVLVQPNADRLRQRILLHNSKIVHFLKPFEIDLLCRVQQDIRLMHRDLANRITAVHHDIHRLMGVLVPDLQDELRARDQRQVFLLEVPTEVAERFRITAIAEHPAYANEASFALHDLSDAFVSSFGRSTRSFRGGMLIAEKTPPMEQYLNLLKCVWLWRKMESSVPQGAIETDSHWPSYVKQLEDDLSSECTRFRRELVSPQVSMPVLRKDMFSIWPEKESARLVDVVTRDEIMEQVLEVPLESLSHNIERNVKLLRRGGSDGKKYRIVISGSEETESGRLRQQTEVIDFDIRYHVINPLYAMPSSHGVDREIILRRDERIAKLSFINLKDVLKFQQAVTGYKAWDSYCEYNVLVSFVIAGRKEPLVETACVQLWIPKPVNGSMVTNKEVTPDNSNSGPTRSGTLATTVAGGSPDPSNRRRDNSITWSELLNRPPMDIPNHTRPGRSETVFSTSWPRQTSPTPMGSSPPQEAPRTQNIARKPVPSPYSRPQRSATQGTAGTGLGVQNSGNNMLNVPLPPAHRTYSLSSNVSTAVSNNSGGSSGSDSHTLTVSTGSNTMGYLHQRPPKPMLVLFTQSPKDGKVSFVSIQMDEETSINAERCLCRKAGPEGSSCRITSLERRQGDASLEATRYEPSQSKGEMDWNIARLALNNSSSPNQDPGWSSLKRVSMCFPTAHSRMEFGGTPNQCQCKNKTEGELKQCLALRHKGLWGEVQEFYRRQSNEYHKIRYESHQQVVNGLIG